MPQDPSKKSPRVLHLPSTIDSRAFESTIRFLYLGANTEIFSPQVTENIQRISMHLDLPSLWEYILVSRDPKQRRLQRMDEVDKAQEDLDSWFHESVLGAAVKLDLDKIDTFRMEQINSTFADLILRADEDESNIPPDAPPGWKPKAVFYPVHKAMLRSEFFTVMFTSPFREGQKLSPDEPLQIIPLEMSPKVLEAVLRFLYSDILRIPLEIALDTLYAADQLLIERLKTKAAMFISTEGNAGLPSDQPQPQSGQQRAGGYNVYDVIRAGWDTRQRRLEEFGAKYVVICHLHSLFLIVLIHPCANSKL